MIGAERAAVDLMLSYLSTNPVEKLPLMLSLAERLDRGGLHRSQIRGIRKALLDEGSVWRTFVENLFRDVDLKIIKKGVSNFIVNATLQGSPA